MLYMNIYLNKPIRFILNHKHWIHFGSIILMNIFYKNLTL